MLVLIDLVSLICLFYFWLHAACFRATRNFFWLAHLFGIGACIYTCMHIPSQTESPLFLATKAGA